MLATIKQKIQPILDYCLIHPPSTQSNTDTIRLFFSVSFISLFSFIVLFVFALISVVNENIQLAYFLGVMAVMNLGNYLTLRFTHQILVTTFVASLLMVALYFYLLLKGGYQNTGLYWCFVFAPMMYFFLGHRFGLLMTVLLTISSYLIFFIPDFPGLTATYSEGAQRRFPVIFGVISFILFIQELSRHRVDEHNKLLTQKLELVARTDELSGLLNRRGGEEALKREYQRGRRSNRFSTILLADIDHFKTINDEHGHSVGDLTIQEVARCMNEMVRENDYVVRWGGEEFLIILTEGKLDSGALVAERIRQNIEALAIEYLTGKISVTVSIGLTSFQRNDNLESALKRVDDALYQAKNGGRNQIKAVI